LSHGVSLRPHRHHWTGPDMPRAYHRPHDVETAGRAVARGLVPWGSIDYNPAFRTHLRSSAVCPPWIPRIPLIFCTATAGTN
jgi:hypothetical protein